MVGSFPNVTEFNSGCESRQKLKQLVWGRQKDPGIIWVNPPGEGLCHGWVSRVYLCSDVGAGIPIVARMGRELVSMDGSVKRSNGNKREASFNGRQQICRDNGNKLGKVLSWEKICAFENIIKF